IRRKKEILENKGGPVLLDTLTYRYSGHSPSDAGAYREKQEVEAWQQFDPLVRYAEQLVEAGVTTTAQIAEEQARIDELICKAYRKAVDESISPRPDLSRRGNLLARTMYSNRRVERLDDREPEVRLAKEHTPRVPQK